MTVIGVESDKLDSILKGLRVGLVANPASIDSSGISSIDIIKKKAKLTALLGLEHGVRGDVLAGEAVGDGESDDGIPIYSLYNGDGISLPLSVIESVDAIIFDIQDLALRFYTYVASLKMIIASCSENDIPLIVLDRPAPLGRRVSGNILSSDSYSFVGPDSLPIRYGLTLGEIANWFNDKLEKKADITIVKLSEWNGQLWTETGRKWISTSPNIPSFDTAFIYSGTCLFEGLNISEGRGSKEPFKLIGAPFIDSDKLLCEIDKLDVRGALIEKADFTPICSKFAGELCHGIRISVSDYEAFDPIIFSLELIFIFFRLFDESAILSAEEGSGLRFIDRLMGKGMIEKLLDDKDGTIATWKAEAEEFRKNIQGYYLY